MSSSDDGGPGPQIEQTTLSIDLNSTVLFVFGMGLYTMVYIGTMCIYFIQKSNRSRIIVGALTALFGVIMGQFALQWRFLQTDYIDNGATRDSIYNAFLFGGSTSQLVNLILNYSGNIVADGILIWRCYYMCGLSMRRISIPLFFFTSEIGLAVASTIIQGKTLFQPGFDTIQTEQIGDIVDGTVSVVTAVTTSLATFIICRRIISSTDTVLLPDTRYRRVIRIVIESASLYSVTAIILAIADFMSVGENGSNLLTIFGLQNYMSAIATTTTGIAPTLTVAQIYLYSAPSRGAASIRRASGLDFYVQSTEQHTSHPTSGTDVLSIKNNTSEIEKESV